MTPTLTDSLHDLAEARRRMEELKENEARLESAVIYERAYKDWQIARLARFNQDDIIENLENDVRERACEVYVSTGDNAPAKGITIKHFKTVVYDTAAATAWCRGVMPGLLVLDGKRFERAAKEGLVQGAPVQIVEEVRATIASDLSAYLDE